MTMSNPQSDTLDLEIAHLATAREALTRMRAETADWRLAVGGNAVSTAQLKQALYRRMLSLEISPDVPLFFGRIDYAEARGAEYDEVCHIGRRHVSAEIGGEPLVIDWRAPMARPFYQARPGDDSGVRLRRRFGFSRGALTAFEDEDLTAGETGDSALLVAEIERPRTGPMRDIVATIQPDQDDLVRADLAQSLCIQGAPGTGKTAVGLHRAAFLLYAHRTQLARSGILVVGPNDSFLSYISDVLPALGEIDAEQDTVASLLGRANGLTVKADGDPEAEVVKGDLRMAEVLHRAVWSHLGTPTETLVLPMGSRRWRVPASLLRASMEALTGPEARYQAGRDLLTQRFAHSVLVRMEESGEITDDRLQNAVARTKVVKDLVNAVWPAVKATKLVHSILTDPAALARAADGLLTDEEQALLIGERPARTPGAMRWTLADITLVDEACDLLTRTPAVGHVIVDEAQDLSPMQLRALGRRAATGSVTLLGDLAQATTPWATRDWADALFALGKPEAEVRELVEGFRVPGAVIDFAARLLPAIAPQLTLPRSIRQGRGQLTFTPARRFVPALVDAAATALDREGTVGVIVPDALAARARKGFAQAGTPIGDVGGDERLVLVPASLAKGLEYDHVVLGEPEDLVEGEPDRVTGLRRLYVCLTRAVTSLTVVHSRPLPTELSASGEAA
jgi:DNA helicase IV